MICLDLVAVLLGERPGDFRNGRFVLAIFASQGKAWGGVHESVLLAPPPGGLTPHFYPFNDLGQTGMSLCTGAFHWERSDCGAQGG